MAAIRAIQELNRQLQERITEIDRVNRELEGFSHSVSHDLRAPLRAIDGFSRILLEDHAAEVSPEARRCLDVIMGNTRRMAQLIDDLLEFSRLGRTAVDISTINMERMARDVFEELRAHEAERNVVLRVDPIPPARGDAAMVRQVFANLLSNAMKYTRGRDPATIEVGYSDGGNSNAYYVRDNGVGFDMQYADKLFGVFQRLHSSKEFEGTGVGLALAHRIVQRHEGHMSAQGKPGEGAIFYFSLPRVAVETTSMSPAAVS